MKNTPILYNTWVQMLSQYSHWLDKRHLYTLVWMVVGLIESRRISLTDGVILVDSRARFAQSMVRRFRRWLDNQRIEVHTRYGPLIQEALTEWNDQVLPLALDTSRLWERYCLVRLSVVYRGRAIPLVWEVLEQSSSSVNLESYRHLLEQAQELIPTGCEVVLLADRGFADTALMAYLKEKWHWHWRIRIKSSFWVYRRGSPPLKMSRLGLERGEARFWHHVYLTPARFGPVHLALAKPKIGKEHWFLVSDQPTNQSTFEEYRLRFDIEENCLDDKSNGFQLESSLIRSAPALSRLCLVLARATLLLVCQGTQVVTAGNRRWVDAHWFRGSSYLKIGWKWVQLAVRTGYTWVPILRLSPHTDPQPARASQQSMKTSFNELFDIQFECVRNYLTKVV